MVAPSLVPRRPGDRVKTDRRDALKLALGWRAGTLTPIWVPDPADEALRDLVRAREDGLEDLLRARHRLSKLLLQAGVRPPGDLRSWSAKHRQWLAQISLPHLAQQVALEHYRLTMDQTLGRLAALDRHLLAVVGESRFTEVIAAFQACTGSGSSLPSPLPRKCKISPASPRRPPSWASMGSAPRVLEWLESVPGGHHSGRPPACPPSRGGSGLALSPSAQGHGPSSSRARRTATLAADDCSSGERAIESPLRPALGQAQASPKGGGGRRPRTFRVHVGDRLRGRAATNGSSRLKARQGL